MQKNRKLSALHFIAIATITSPAFAQVNLGTAQGFAVLAGSTVTNTGATVITGNAGVSPGSAITGFPPGIVSGGSLHAADAVSTQAHADLATAYNVAAGMTCTDNLTGQNLGGLTLTPGVYCFSTTADLNGTLVLDMQGDPNATFVIQVGSTLTAQSASSMTLINNAGASCAPNVYWQVGSSATFGSGSTFTGTILALTSITMITGAGLSGNALAINGAVTMDTNTVATCTLTTPVRLQSFGVD